MRAFYEIVIFMTKKLPELLSGKPSSWMDLKAQKPNSHTMAENSRRVKKLVKQKIAAY
jgi:hypothetical protein